MIATNNCYPMRRYLEEYLENHPNSRYRHYEIAPLCEFAKLGHQLKNLYIIRNLVSNKMQLWRDIDSQYLFKFTRQNATLYQSIEEIIEDDFQSCIAKQIVPFEFDDINILLEDRSQLDYPYSYMAFLIRENAKTGMFISNGVNIDLKHWYESIDLIGFDNLLAKDKDQSFILDKMGNVVCTLGQYRFIRLIDGGTYLAENDERQLIIKFNGTVVAPIVLGRFERLTDENHYLTHINNGYAIYDFYGNMIGDEYESIKNSNENYIVAIKDDESYLLDLSGKVKLKSNDFMTVCRSFWQIRE